MITPVPCHPDTKKIRGYNQSFLLAELLSNHFKIPLENDIIQVVCAKTSQTKLPVAKRQKNVEGVFKVKKEVHNKKIILVDDILTTGATASSCSRELKAKGAKTVTAVTVAKTIWQL
ncbi:MAG: phosphoribosyltransferase family protein [Candidatus Omnitrophica bacterium]|nr:phosphoribosyltransferase family protein [Candidatus Omnitrophota bacterium]